MLQKKLLIVFFAFLSFFALAQKTYIPDDNFEQVLIDLGIDKDGTLNGSIATADIESITELDVHGKMITDLTGIEDFSDLEKLNCAQNQLTNLDVTKNSHLNYLNFTFNQISHIDLSKNTELETLYAAYNKLTNYGFNVTSNLNLEDLSYANNSINSLDLSKNTALERLDCSGNTIMTIDLSNNTTLHYLNIGLNYISNLDLSANTEIDTLQCHQNSRLTQLDLSKNTKLLVLNCSNGKLTGLDLEKNTDLRELRCNINELTFLNVKNGYNSKITWFDATGNADLQCIQVDDGDAANNGQLPYTYWKKDDTCTYSTDCQYALVVADENFNRNLVLYPNPCSGYVYFETRFPVRKIQIYNVVGQSVKSINQPKNEINFSNLSKGIYILKFYSDNAVGVKKLIKI